jgi:hypothetical protein
MWKHPSRRQGGNTGDLTDLLEESLHLFDSRLCFVNGPEAGGSGLKPVGRGGRGLKPFGDSKVLRRSGAWRVHLKLSGCQFREALPLQGALLPG